jgi:hypothetical protein
MDKISELIDYKNTLMTAGFDDISKLKEDTKSRLVELTTLYSVSDNAILGKLIAMITMQDNMLKRNLKEEIGRVDKLISSLELKYNVLSSTLYNTSFKSENFEARQKARPLNDDYKLFIKSIVEKYCDYHYAGMEISPMFFEITDRMTTFDPIYLIDHDPKLLSSIVDCFDAKYRHKLRTYTMNLRSGLDKLPLSSISFISVINTFERYDIESIEATLINMKKLLLPGGSIIFTFNNCDYSSGAKQVEDGRACYQTTKKIDNLLERLGYICINFSVFNKHQTVVEAKIPGILESNKVSPCIGQIVDIERLDINEKEVYTQLLGDTK